MERVNLIYGYEYDSYIELRKNVQLQLCNVKDYIYIIKFDSLYFISKEDVSMLEIEKYIYVGKMLGQDLYVEPLLLKSNHNYKEEK